MKKHLIDSCTKATFSYDNIFYQQCGGVSTRSSLAPVLVNITLKEFEKVVMTLFMEREILKLYCRYVDYRLVLVKEDQIDKVRFSTHSTITYGLLSKIPVMVYL